MTTQRTPFLRVQRAFPQDPQALTVEVNKSYVDIANAVNNRTIGIFPVNAPVANGETWFVNGETGKQQVLRQVYQFTSFSSPQSIAHGINLSQISAFTRIYGTAYDGTSYYPLPYVDVSDADNQINIVVGTTDITITAGSGSPPSITSGFVVLEWLSNV